MKKATILMLGFLLILLFSPNANAVVTLPFSDDFESYPVGAPPPSPWTNLAGGPGIVTTTQAHSGQKSVVVSGGPFSCDSSVIDLGTNYTDFLQYEGWVYSAGGEGLIGFHEQFQNMAPSFNAVRFKANGDAFFESADRDTGFKIQIASGLSPGWHHVKAQLNFEHLIGSVWLDGTLVIDSLPISPKENVVYEGYGSGPLRHIGIIHLGYTPVYFDDFSVTEFGVSGCIKVRGVPIVGSKVRLKQKGEKAQKTTTDANGCFEFKQIVSGKKFKIKIRVEGSQVP